MDGNGRWAQRRGLPRVLGHRMGVEAVREILFLSTELGLEYLTLYTFSMENWQRPVEEVTYLMELFTHLLYEEVDNLKRRGVRVHMLGKREFLPEKVDEALRFVERETASGTGVHLYLALSYGGRSELVDAARRLANEVCEGKMQPEELDEQRFREALYAPELPDVDLLIRTSGEWRISNFLLWQVAYAELYITSTHWPDFRTEEFLRALEAYARRERRFGGVPGGS